MKITIAQRLHPFSHQAGTKFLLPRTSWCVQVFPTRLCFFDLSGRSESFFLALDFTGPIREFTAELNLERGFLTVFGATRKGYMRYQLCQRDAGLFLTMEKAPGEGFFLAKGESKKLCAAANIKTVSEERLSLGVHKAQDWDLIRRRRDCKEIFPHWLKLGQLIGDAHARGAGENFALLELCKESIAKRDRENVLETFENLFLAAFEGVLVPRLQDTDYQGIAPRSEGVLEQASALALLHESAQYIRSLFIQEKAGVVSLLPCLPTQFHSGRMTGVQTASGAVLCFEWAKKALKRVIIQPDSNEKITLQLPKGIKSFRIIWGKKGSSRIAVLGKTDLVLEAGKVLQLDRFQN